MNEENCPFCGRKMIKGSITADGRTRIMFVPDGGSFSMLDVNREHIEKNTVAKAKLFGYAKPPSYKCESCGKIIIDTIGEKS